VSGISRPLHNNRELHNWLVNGVPMDIVREDGGTGEHVTLVDFENLDNNDWLVVNQFTVKGPKHLRRPDIVVFLNGLPIAVQELKNPADLNADIWKAYNQLQTYKSQVDALFHSNELLVISDELQDFSLDCGKVLYGLSHAEFTPKTFDPVKNFRSSERNALK